MNLTRRTFLAALGAALAAPFVPKSTPVGDYFVPHGEQLRGLLAVIDEARPFKGPIAGMTFNGVPWVSEPLFDDNRIYAVNAEGWTGYFANGAIVDCIDADA